MRAGVLLLVVVAAPAFTQPITRGPYLQLAGEREITVVFQTSQPGQGGVRFGVAGQPLSQRVIAPQAGTGHVLRLTGLTPSTRYQYELELDGQPLAQGPSYRFRTHPPKGADEAFRLFAWGDSGTAGPGQLRVAARLAGELNDAALSLILGDIIYPLGEPQDYDAKFFRPYAELSRRMVIWPVVGNHDVAFDPTGGPWRDAFHTPANNPLSTELYYSFDYANAHVVVLDTHVNGFEAGSTQLTWAAADLAASTATWKLVAFHVPPYSGGTHLDNEAVKANILPVLEAAGADLVFAGHSHVYERTFLLKQHTIVQNDPSRYSKPTSTTGTLYVVSGTAGQSGGLAAPGHPLMAVQLGNVLGASVVDFDGTTAHGYFLKDDGRAVDLFRLDKGADTRPPSLVAARALTATQIEVVFSEPVQGGGGPTGAERLAAWAFTPPLEVQGAQLASDGRTVLLTTAPQTAGASVLSVSSVADRASPANTLSTGSISFVASLRFVTRETPLRFFVATSAPPPTWFHPAFDDASWTAGAQPIGVGDPRVVTSAPMGDALSLFTRLHFESPVGPERVRGLTLEVDYDDGFVAWLNGRELARRGLPGDQTHRTPAFPRAAGLREVVPLPGAEAFIEQGDNVLAVEVHNSAVDSSTVFLDARLWAHASAKPPEPDAGPVIDAGVMEDAGALFDAGVRLAPDGGPDEDEDGGVTGDDPPPPPPPPPCGCTSTAGPLLALALLAVLKRR